MPPPETSLPLIPPAETRVPVPLTVSAVRAAAVAAGMNPDMFATPVSVPESSAAPYSHTPESHGTPPPRKISDVFPEKAGWQELKPKQAQRPDGLAAAMDAAAAEPPDLRMVTTAFAQEVQKELQRQQQGAGATIPGGSRAAERTPTPTLALPAGLDATATQAFPAPRIGVQGLGEIIDKDLDSWQRYQAALAAQRAPKPRGRHVRGAEQTPGNTSIIGKLSIGGMRRAISSLRSRGRNRILPA